MTFPATSARTASGVYLGAVTATPVLMPEPPSVVPSVIVSALVAGSQVSVDDVNVVVSETWFPVTIVPNRSVQVGVLTVSESDLFASASVTVASLSVWVVELLVQTEQNDDAISCSE